MATGKPLLVATTRCCAIALSVLIPLTAGAGPSAVPSPGCEPERAPRHTAEATGPTSPEASTSRLVDPEVGYALVYPSDWRVAGQVVTTEFAQGARCQSVEVVDFEPPPDAGPAAAVLRSFVQICTKPLVDASTLDDFMRQTYGDALPRLFSKGEIDGRPAYRALTASPHATIFVQTKAHRVQIVSSVRADRDTRLLRSRQVRDILDSLSIVEPAARP